MNMIKVGYMVFQGRVIPIYDNVAKPRLSIRSIWLFLEGPSSGWGTPEILWTNLPPWYKVENSNKMTSIEGLLYILMKSPNRYAELFRLGYIQAQASNRRVGASNIVEADSEIDLMYRDSKYYYTLNNNVNQQEVFIYEEDDTTTSSGFTVEPVCGNGGPSSR